MSFSCKRHFTGTSCSLHLGPKQLVTDDARRIIARRIGYKDPRRISSIALRGPGSKSGLSSICVRRYRALRHHNVFRAPGEGQGTSLSESHQIAPETRLPQSERVKEAHNTETNIKHPRAPWKPSLSTQTYLYLHFHHGRRSE